MNNIPLLIEMLRDSMAQGQRPTLLVTSNSMSPLLKTDDFVVLEAVTVTQLQAGDIITIEQGGELITHRFWGLKNGAMMTRGDRPLTFDPPTHPTQLVGRVIARQRNTQELTLANGNGAKINQALYQLAQTEAQWLTRQAASTYPSLPNAQQQRFTTRLIRRLFRWRAEQIVKE